jgi:hypothetical protein
MYSTFTDLSISATHAHDSPRLLQECPSASEQCAAQLWGMAIPFLNRSFMNQWLNQRIVGTVIASAMVETRNIEAASDSTALYLAAKSTTTVASGVGAMLLNQNKHFHLSAVFAIQLTILLLGLGQDYAIGLLRKIFCPYADLTLERK